MQTIVNQPQFVELFLGKQNIDSTKKYRPLKYLVFCDCADGHLVYNTLTKQLILTDDAEYSALKQLEIDFNSDFKELFYNHFFVPNDFDEKKCTDDLQALNNNLDNEEYLNSFTILPTTDCNARCFYCCENGQKKIKMTNQIAIDVAKFIINESKGKKVSIMWFGGEPLYNIDAINIISDSLREHNIDFKSNLISNAYLFDSNIIELAKNQWNVKSVQITLDGTEEIYNKIKNYIYDNITSPFMRVINNIEALSNNNINVIIRLNMDLYNKNNLYELTDYLHSRFSGNNNVSIYIRMLFDNTSDVQINRTNEDRELLYKEFEKFEDYIFLKGMLHNQMLKPKYGRLGCIGTNKHGTVIMPTGELGLCDLHTDSDLYGNIYDGVTNTKTIEDFIALKPPVAECENCPIRPNCYRLSKCIYYVRDCEKYEQQRLIHQLQRYMLHTYSSLKSKTLD